MSVLLFIFNLISNTNYFMFYYILFVFFLDRSIIFTINLTDKIKYFIYKKKHNVKNLKILNLNETTCSICYNDIISTNVTKLDCSHVFCSTCLIEWFATNNFNNPTCPNCRKLILNNNENTNIQNRNMNYFRRIGRRNAVLLDNDESYRRFMQLLDLPNGDDDDNDDNDDNDDDDEFAFDENDTFVTLY